MELRAEYHHEAVEGRHAGVLLLLHTMYYLADLLRDQGTFDLSAVAAAARSPSPGRVAGTIDGRYENADAEGLEGGKAVVALEDVPLMGCKDPVQRIDGEAGCLWEQQEMAQATLFGGASCTTRRYGDAGEMEDFDGDRQSCWKAEGHRG